MKSRSLFAKLDASFFSNRKVIKAGPEGALVFIHALCVNAQRGAVGVVPAGDLEPWFVSRQTGLTLEAAERGVTNAVTAELLTIASDHAFISGWDEEWGRYASNDADRARKYRENKKKTLLPATESHERHVTNHVTSDASRIDREREERERSGVTPGGSLSLPSDFAPSEAATKIAAMRRLDLPFELAKFRNHANEKAKNSSNWDASFCNWLHGSRDVDRKPSKRKAPAKQVAFVTRQNTPAGVRIVLTEENGDQRVINEEEAKDFASVHRQSKPSGDDS